MGFELELLLSTGDFLPLTRAGYPTVLSYLVAQDGGGGGEGEGRNSIFFE